MRRSLRSNFLVLNGGWKGISKEDKEAGCEWLVTEVLFVGTGEEHYIWTDLDRQRRRSGAKHRPWVGGEAKFEMNWGWWKVLD